MIADLANVVKDALFDIYSRYNDYYCIQTAPFRCGCRGKPWTFVHFSGSIIVWENNDDETILHAAKEFKNLDLDPHIIKYNAIMGSCVDWKDIPIGANVG